MLIFLLQYILKIANNERMQLPHLYQCLGDETRLRIVHLLFHRPLCVRDLQTILGASQVKISKHLICLKRYGVVESRVARNWRIYQLPAERPYELQRHLECLQECARHAGLFAEDLTKLQALAPISEGRPTREPVSYPAKPQADESEETLPSGHLEEHLL